MNKKIDVGGTLSEVFSIYGANAGVLLPVAFWLFLVVAIVNGLAGSSLILLLLASVVGIVAGTLYQGTVVNLVLDVQDGRRDFSAGELLSSATPFIAPLIGAGILAGIAIGIGLFLLLVPGLILLTIWAVIAPVIVVEKSGVMDSFGRSRALVRGNGWPVFGAIFVAFLIVIVGGLVFGAIAASIADGPLLRIVFSALASTITAPISALVAAVLYFRLRSVEGSPAAPVGDPDAPAPPTVPPAPPAV
ncbi:MAG TPA: hypothetical protein VGO13_00295 [Solirubrobacterales bacterium]|jgi:hypothetical protein|nr:hypothetical protein [Solirubrobacterales bacterium]